MAKAMSSRELLQQRALKEKAAQQKQAAADAQKAQRKNRESKFIKDFKKGNKKDTRSNQDVIDKVLQNRKPTGLRTLETFGKNKVPGNNAENIIQKLKEDKKKKKGNYIKPEKLMGSGQ